MTHAGYHEKANRVRHGLGIHFRGHRHIKGGRVGCRDQPIGPTVREQEFAAACEELVKTIARDIDNAAACLE